MKLKFRSGSRQLLLAFCMMMVTHTSIFNRCLAQEITTSLKGLVESESGERLQGVSVVLKNDSSGAEMNTLTDAQGVFVFAGLRSGISYEVSISYVGYEKLIVKKILKEGREEAMVINLKSTASSMDGLVVVGYGVQKRRDVTGAIASVPQQRLEKVPNLNIAQALQGSVAGVLVQQSQAGAASEEEILVRGRNSILAQNNPLIVVDGIPYGGQLRDININDVQSIEVLKDASAAAIYGSRGSNGVILVTTKTGLKGKPTISYDGRYAIQQVINVPFFMTAQEFYDFKNIREPGRITASEQKVYDEGKGVDWGKLALREGNSHQHNLSVAGGTENIKYYIGGNLLDVKGVTINDDYKRYTSRINLDAKISSWLSVGTRTQLTFDDRSGATINWEDVLRTNPLTTAFNEDGTINMYPWSEYEDIGNPLEPLYYQNTDKSYQLITNNFAQVDFPFLKGLSYRINTGIRKTSIDVSNYIGRDTKTGLEARGVARTERTLQDNTVIENILSYNKQYGLHGVFATALYSYEENTISSNILNARAFPNDFLTFYSSAQAGLVDPEYPYSHTDLISQMLRLNYSYDSRYLLTVTGRRDGFSGFGSRNKWGVFPSVAVGWNLDSESFFPFKDLFEKFKLRASWGRNGNQAVGAYESISRLGEENMVALDQAQPGYVPNKLGQDKLRWEYTSALNIGIDFSLLKGRLSGDINVYETKTSDLLLNRTISLVHGLTSITQNIGSTQNRGIELLLNTQNITGKKFSWSTTGNLSYVKNKILSLYGDLDENGNEVNDVANKWFIGQPIRVNFDYVMEGIWQEDKADEAALYGATPGSARVKDVDGDFKRSADDRQVIGQQDPKFTWGMSNSFSYKNFNLEVFIHGVHGLTRENRILQDASASSEVRRNVLKKNWWTPENPTNDFYANSLTAQTAVIYENASFIRLKDVALSYDMNSPALTRAGFNRLRLYVTGRNLFTITKWTASDPELNFGRGALPLQREFVFGLNIILN